MTDDPQSRRPRNQLPEEKRSGFGRAFPLLAPLIIVVVALIIMAVFWLPQ